MTKSHRTSIVPIGNSRGVRILKEYLNVLGEDQVVLEKMPEGILIRPLPTALALSEWDALFAKTDVSKDDNLADWDTTMADGLEKEAPYE